MIKQGYSYIDISLVPATISNISSRSECNPFDEYGNLPIFASCMSTVVNTDNYKIFKEHNIMPIIPRNIDINKRILLMNNQIWVAVSLTEFNNLFIDNYKDREEQIWHKYYVCVDIANGHMQSLYQSCKKAKEIAENSNYELIIMTGNIANPQTYKWICENSNYLHNGEYHTCIDYIRLSIGSGSQCTTSSNVSIHYPVASLISECYEIKHKMIYYSTTNKSFPKLVADGGIRNYSDVIKALALGADYVMVGGLFASMYESASPLVLGTYNNTGYMTYEECDYQYTSEEKKRKDIKNRNLYKECYGMSTKKAQELIDPTHKKKTAEGKHSMMKVQHTLQQWTENMIDYLKSAMSYCGAKRLDDFIGQPDVIINSPGTILSVNK